MSVTPQSMGLDRHGERRRSPRHLASAGGRRQHDGSAALSGNQETDPRHHTATIKGMLTDHNNHLREDIGEIAEPEAQALFETTADVLNGLVTADEHFERGTEGAWRR